MTDGTDSLLGDVLVERDSQCWQVHVAVELRSTGPLSVRF